MIDWDEAWKELKPKAAAKPEKNKPERAPEFTPIDPEKAVSWLHPRPLVAKPGQSVFTTIPPHPSKR